MEMERGRRVGGRKRRGVRVEDGGALGVLVLLIRSGRHIPKLWRAPKIDGPFSAPLGREGRGRDGGRQKVGARLYSTVSC